MGILDGIVEWIAEQVMNGLDLITTSVLGALGCDMTVFLRYFPAAETMYKVFVALAIGIILLNWVWQLFKNFGLGAGIEAEDPVRLSIRSVLFILLAYFSDGIVDTVLKIGGTPYHWIMDSDLPALSFADFNSVMLAIIGVCANGAVALIALIVVLVLAWNYLKLLFEAAERYVLLGVLVYTAPVAFSMGASQSTSNIFKSWCRIENGVIYTKDHRYVKVVEVIPINFLLRSAREQRSIIYSFVSYLKISPVKLQFKVLTRRADIGRHMETVRREMAQETNEQCRLMQEDYLQFIQQICSREAVTRRFFLVFEYEPWSNARRTDEEAVPVQLPSLPAA